MSQSKRTIPRRQLQGAQGLRRLLPHTPRLTTIRRRTLVPESHPREDITLPLTSMAARGILRKPIVKLDTILPFQTSQVTGNSQPTVPTSTADLRAILMGRTVTRKPSTRPFRRQINGPKRCSSSNIQGELLPNSPQSCSNCVSDVHAPVPAQFAAEGPSAGV